MHLRPATLLLLFALPAFAEIHGEMRAKARRQIERDRPDTVVVENIDFDGVDIVLRGSSRNVNAVANFVENVKADPMFTAPEVGYVQVRKDTDPPLYEFELRFSVEDETKGE